MDRQALVLYLENVRDLEVVKSRINELWDRERYFYNEEYNNHPTSVGNKPEEEEISIIEIVLFIICLAWTVFWLFGVIESSLTGGTIWAYLILGAFAAVGLAGIRAFLRHFHAVKTNNKNNKENYNRVVRIAEANKPLVAKLQNEWNQKNNYYKSQYEKADAILSKFYEMNIIPIQYRKLSAACYLYDFMNSSQESFQMALLSNQIEDGIRRIETRLNEIINRLDDVIYQQRVMKDGQINQNNRMIEHLKRMESSQRNIEEYSRLSANYNEAQAFISMAYYLKNR